MHYAVTHSCRESIRGATIQGAAFSVNRRQVNAVFTRHCPSASQFIDGAAGVILRPVCEGNHPGSRDPFGPSKGWAAPHPLLTRVLVRQEWKIRNMKLTNELTENANVKCY